MQDEKGGQGKLGTLRTMGYRMGEVSLKEQSDGWWREQRITNVCRTLEV